MWWCGGVWLWSLTPCTCKLLEDTTVLQQVLQLFCCANKSTSKNAPDDPINDARGAIIIEDVAMVAGCHPTAPTGVVGRKRATNVLEFFTNDPNPHKSKSVMCKHCLTIFNHHKKGAGYETSSNVPYYLLLQSECKP